MKTTHGLLFVLILISIAGCNIPASSAQPSSATQTQESNLSTVSPFPATGTANIIFTDGTMITMDDSNPTAQAVAIRGETILAVGSNEAMDKYRGTDTILIDLGGRTLVPGFIDAHQYRIQRRAEVGITDASTIIETAIEQGWTSLDELYVDQPMMDQLLALDKAGTLRVRVNAYLPFMEYNADGTMLGDWYKAYHQGQSLSPRVRVAGLIGFADYDNANVMLWKQDDLNTFLLNAQKEGWSVALKTVSTRSLETILNAFEYVQTIDPSAMNSRGRLEHMLFATPDQIARIKKLGLVPIINLNNPGQLVGDQGVDQLIAREPQGSYTPWRNLEQAGILTANATGWPSYYVDEPIGAPFGSPMHLIYQAVTRVGNLGTQPYPWLLDQSITAEQAMQVLTINGAYASFEENTKGSLGPGKFADLVILSDDPLSVSAQQVNNIQVLLTMIGGKVEYCAAGFETLCPGTSSAMAPTLQVTNPPSDAMTVTASASLPDHPPSDAIDDSVDTWWSAGSGPDQWIQVDVGKTTTISAIRLVISQYPAGETDHQVWAGADANNLTLVYEFKGNTKDPDTLEFIPPTPLTNIRYIKILTTKSPSWVAWREIRIITSAGN